MYNYINKMILKNIRGLQQALKILKRAKQNLLTVKKNNL